MMSEFERGLLAAFLRLNLTDAQQDILSKFYPEIVQLCGFNPRTKAGVSLEFYKEVERLCNGRLYIQAIKAVRQYAVDHNVDTLKGLKEAKEWVDANFRNAEPTRP